MENINLDLINSITAEDTEVLLKLLELKKEAENAYNIIKDNVRFSIGENSKIIWRDNHNAEYITHEGIWQARYLHQTYDVPCTVEGIFNALKYQYLNKNATCAASYFRSFVDKLYKQNIVVSTLPQ